MLARTLALVAALAALAVAYTAAANGASPEALTQAVAATQAAKADFAFDFELVSSKQAFRARFEPGASPRLRLVHPARETLDASQRRAFDNLAESMEGVSWCASEGMGRVSDVRLIREDETSATYAFQPTRESIRGAQARRFADRLSGEFTLNKPSNDISGLRIFTPQGFSPAPLTRVDHFAVAITCAVAPNGRRYAAETVTEARGAAFGSDFNERSTQRASNLSRP